LGQGMSRGRANDVNLRKNFHSRSILETSLHIVNVMKLNDQELHVRCRVLEPGHDWNNDDNRTTAITDRFSLDVVTLTRGSGTLSY